MANRGTKKVTYAHDVEVVDKETGEVTVERKESNYQVETEPEFVKLFCDDIGRVLRLSKSDANLFHAVVSKMNYENMICTAEPMRSFLLAATGMSENLLEKTIKGLKQKGILLPLTLNGKKHRGWYVVNPNVVGRGTWSHIKAMRLCIDYDNSGRSIGFGITTEDGEETLLTLPTKF